MDVGVYVTTLRSIKNFLLIGDVVKSVWFVAFQVQPLISFQFLGMLGSLTRTLIQEDPFKLLILAKDVLPINVTKADFLFMSNGQFYITAGDGDGVIRLLEYDPSGLHDTLSILIYETKR